MSAKQFHDLFEAPEVQSVPQGPHPRGIGKLLFGPGRDVDAAHVALMEAVRQQDDFQVQEVLQVLTGSSLEEVLQRKDADGHAVLHLASTIAARSGENDMGASIVSYLMHCRADLEQRNLLGETPLALAVRESLLFSDVSKAVLCLLEGRADPDACDDLGETPLMDAACHGSGALCEALLRRRADVALQAHSGATAKDFAESQGHKEANPFDSSLFHHIPTK